MIHAHLEVYYGVIIYTISYKEKHIYSPNIDFFIHLTNIVSDKCASILFTQAPAVLKMHKGTEIYIF